MSPRDSNGTAGAGTGLDRALAAAVAVRHTPRPPGPLANAVTFAWRALLKIKHGPEQMFDVVVTPIMFTVMFTYLFGGALAGSSDAYLQWLLPGIMVQTVMFTSIYTGFTLNTDFSKGIFDRFKSMPIWAPAPIAGAIAGDMVRHTASSLLVLGVGFLMGFHPEAGVGGVLLSILLLLAFAFGIGWIFTTVGLIARTPSTVMTMSWLVLMPVTFMSNIFVDPATMPDWLAGIVSINPVALLVTAVRATMAGTETLGQIGLALLAPATALIVFAPIAMLLYRRER